MLLMQLLRVAQGLDWLFARELSRSINVQSVWTARRVKGPASGFAYPRKGCSADQVSGEQGHETGNSNCLFTFPGGLPLRGLHRARLLVPPSVLGVVQRQCRAFAQAK